MNVILMIIDTLRYDHVGAHGNFGMKTPNLDRLRSRSWSFDRAFAASFPTIPHRTDVITGRYGAPFHSWKPLDFDVPTLPRALAGAGYCTQLIHDTPHLVNGGHAFDYPFHAWTQVRGAEVDRPLISGEQEYLENWRHDPLFDGILEDEDAARPLGVLPVYIPANRGRKREADWNVARLFTTASRFARENRQRDNFFLWLDCFDPHEPWDAPAKYMKMYDKSPGYDGSIDPRTFLIQVANAPGLSREGVERIRAAYRAKVSLMDNWLGKFLDTLEETGLMKKSMLILTADHGTNLDDRDGWRFHKTMPPRQNEAHVPMFVYAPGAGSGRCESLVQPQDIFATMAGFAGVSVPDGVESREMLKLAQGKAAASREVALTGGASRGPAIYRTWRKPGQVLFSAFDGEWRLGFTADPEKCELSRLGSRENVAGDNRAVVASLHKKALKEIAARGLDPALVKWLKRGGKGKFPGKYRTAEAHDAPPGWQAYYQQRYRGE